MNTGWKLGRDKGAREENFVEMVYYPGGGVDRGEPDRGWEAPEGKSPGGGGGPPGENAGGGGA